MRFQRFSRDYTTYFEVFFEFWRTKTKQTKNPEFVSLWVLILNPEEPHSWWLTDFNDFTVLTLVSSKSHNKENVSRVALKACLFFICVHGIIEWGNRIYLLNTPPPVACRRHDRLPCDNGSTWRNLGETTLRCRESTGERLRRIRDKRSDLLSTNTLPPFVEAADKDVWEGDLCSAGSSWR